MRTVLRLGTMAAVIFVLAAPAAACPVCDSETGKRVRAGIFGDRFAADAGLTLLPFPVLAGLVVLIHFSFPNPKPAAISATSGNEPEEASQP